MVKPYPLRDVQDEAPATRCPKCDGEVWPGEAMFNWNGEGMICLDCFKAAVSALLDSNPCLVAAEIGVEFKEV